jgi:hypothetical protein
VVEALGVEVPIATRPFEVTSVFPAIVSAEEKRLVDEAREAKKLVLVPAVSESEVPVALLKKKFVAVAY